MMPETQPSSFDLNSNSTVYENCLINNWLPYHLSYAIDYINTHLDQELSLDQLCAIAKLSPYHFARSFKQMTGLSPHQYIICQRVERAKKLLLEAQMSIAEVAIACGFTHQSHLNRHFKRLVGVTPRTFLKS
jgi:AraC family transcriptional regulator